MTEADFKVGDLVWAKMKGYPSWPAEVVDPPEESKSRNSYYVFFYGCNMWGWIPPKNMEHHKKELVQKYRHGKKPKNYTKAVDAIVDAHEHRLKRGDGDSARPMQDMIDDMNGDEAMETSDRLSELDLVSEKDNSAAKIFEAYERSKIDAFRKGKQLKVVLKKLNHDVVSKYCGKRAACSDDDWESNSEPASKHPRLHNVLTSKDYESQHHPNSDERQNDKNSSNRSDDSVPKNFQDHSKEVAVVSLGSSRISLLSKGDDSCTKNDSKNRVASFMNYPPSERVDVDSAGPSHISFLSKGDDAVQASNSYLSSFRKEFSSATCPDFEIETVVQELMSELLSDPLIVPYSANPIFQPGLQVRNSYISSFHEGLSSDSCIDSENETVKSVTSDEADQVLNALQDRNSYISSFHEGLSSESCLDSENETVKSVTSDEADQADHLPDSCWQRLQKFAPSDSHESPLNKSSSPGSEDLESLLHEHMLSGNQANSSSIEALVEIAENPSMVLSKIKYPDCPDSPSVNFHHINPKLKDITPSNLRFGFIGLGRIGQRILRNLIWSGHSVIIWNRTASCCNEFMEAVKAKSPAEVVSSCDIVFCCLSDSFASKSVFFMKEGILSGLKTKSRRRKCLKGLVEFTSLEMETAKTLSGEVHGVGCRFLEVSFEGKKKDADYGELNIVAAGDKSLFIDCESCFRAIGKDSLYYSQRLGEVSFLFKLQKNSRAVHYSALAEVLLLIEKSGLDKQHFLTNVIKDGKFVDVNKNYVHRGFLQAGSPMSIKTTLNQSDSLGVPMPINAVVKQMICHNKRMNYTLFE